MSRLRAFLVASSVAAAAALAAQAQQSHPAADTPQGVRGHEHAENHDWYRDLKQPATGHSCCNGTTNSVNGDCRPTRAYVDDDGMWYALLDGRWVSVPPRVVLKQLAPDGRSHICASKSGLIYCFLGGSPKS